MSTIGSIGGQDSSQLEMLRQMLSQRTRAQAPPQALDSTTGAERAWALLESRASELGLDTEQLADLQDEVKNAVMAALDDTDLSNPEAGREAVQGAILATLESNGMDTSALKADMTAHQNMRPNGPPPGGPPPGGARPAGAGSPSDGSETERTDEEDSTSSSTVNLQILKQLAELFPLLDEQA
jgi:hypothetical protein